jgi:hypothetical protein
LTPEGGGPASRRLQASLIAKRYPAAIIASRTATGL